MKDLHTGAVVVETKPLTLTRQKDHSIYNTPEEGYSQILAVFFVKDLSSHQGCSCGDKADGGGARRHRGERGGCRPKFWLENDESEKNTFNYFLFCIGKHFIKIVSHIGSVER